jgi:hypothetical protein
VEIAEKKRSFVGLTLGGDKQPFIDEIKGVPRFLLENRLADSEFGRKIFWPK